MISKYKFYLIGAFLLVAAVVIYVYFRNRKKESGLATSKQPEIEDGFVSPGQGVNKPLPNLQTGNQYVPTAAEGAKMYPISKS